MAPDSARSVDGQVDDVAVPMPGRVVPRTILHRERAAARALAGALWPLPEYHAARLFFGPFVERIVGQAEPVSYLRGAQRLALRVALAAADPTGTFSYVGHVADRPVDIRSLACEDGPVLLLRRIAPYLCDQIGYRTVRAHCWVIVAMLVPAESAVELGNNLPLIASAGLGVDGALLLERIPQERTRGELRFLTAWQGQATVPSVLPARPRPRGKKPGRGVLANFTARRLVLIYRDVAHDHRRAGLEPPGWEHLAAALTAVVKRPVNKPLSVDTVQRRFRDLGLSFPPV